MNATPRQAFPQGGLRQRLTSLLDHLEAGLIERGRIVRLAFLAALAGEHTLLVGPPGTAKSELARRLHLAFDGARYFERLLTRFTVPEELFGPLSISALEQDRYERMTAGFLPQATIAFIDEVFKANSAILNALLTLLNEREFDNGAGRERCPVLPTRWPRPTWRPCKAPAWRPSSRRAPTRRHRYFRAAGAGAGQARPAQLAAGGPADRIRRRVRRDAGGCRPHPPREGRTGAAHPGRPHRRPRDHRLHGNRRRHLLDARLAPLRLGRN
jgi:hypothetical protein